jgi:hypothetical protein
MRWPRLAMDWMLVRPTCRRCQPRDSACRSGFPGQQLQEGGVLRAEKSINSTSLLSIISSTLFHRIDPTTSAPPPLAGPHGEPTWR